jgi:hypothetical protein
MLAQLRLVSDDIEATHGSQEDSGALVDVALLARDAVVLDLGLAHHSGHDILPVTHDHCIDHHSGHFSKPGRQRARGKVRRTGAAVAIEHADDKTERARAFDRSGIGRQRRWKIDDVAILLVVALANGRVHADGVARRQHLGFGACVSDLFRFCKMFFCDKQRDAAQRS